jgi:deazaflavin-dependent oxidoreductase (nitroreductase family)
LTIDLQTLLLRAFSAVNTGLYRLSGGRIGGKMKGVPILLLTTTGRKSGKRRTQPLLCIDDGGKLAVIASKGGAPEHPAWYRNLLANPDVEVELGRSRRRMRARTATGEERQRLWARAVELYPDYADYQTKTSREIPVVALDDV